MATAPAPNAPQRAANVKIPGEPAGEREADRDVAGAASLDDGTRAPGGPTTVTLTQAQLTEMVNRAVAQGMAQARAPVRTVNPEEALPTQAEVMAGIAAGKIKVPTLSKDGYVVPPNYGEPANPAIKR